MTLQSSEPEKKLLKALKLKSQVACNIAGSKTAQGFSTATQETKKEWSIIVGILIFNLEFIFSQIAQQCKEKKLKQTTAPSKRNYWRLGTTRNVCATLDRHRCRVSTKTVVKGDQ